MSGFENFARQAQEIELEIVRKGIALGIDWDDPLEVQLLAQDALACKPNELDCDYDDYQQHARNELFGLVHLMLAVMKESAEENMHTHGGVAWKALARALWAEHERQKN
jgi:hypothetical protein